jgi:hypothetical protein
MAGFDYALVSKKEAFILDKFTNLQALDITQVKNI